MTDEPDGHAKALHGLSPRYVPMWTDIELPELTPEERRREVRRDFWMLYGEAILCTAVFFATFTVVMLDYLILSP